MPGRLVTAVAVCALVIAASALTAYCLGLILHPDTVTTVEGGVILTQSEGELEIWCYEPELTLQLRNFEGLVNLANCVPGSTIEGVVGLEEAEGTSISFRCADEFLDVSVNPPARGEFTFAVMGDSQGRNDVLSAVLPHLEGCEFAFICGDLTSSGTGDQFATVQDMLSASPVPVYATPGNHDAMSGGTLEYENRFGPPQYGFDFGGVRFLVVDSSDLSVTDEQISWIRGEFAEADRRVVMTHAPFLDPFGDNHTLFPDSCVRMSEFCESDEIEAVFTGHIHAFNRTEIGGTDLIITGGAGGTLIDGGHHFVNVTATWQGKLGFEKIDVTVDPSALPHLTLVSETGDCRNLGYEELLAMEAVEGFSSFENLYGNVGGAGNYSGVLVRDLVELIGGMSESCILRVTSSDGYAQEFGYLNVYPEEEWLELQGEMVIASSLESVVVPDWGDGPKLVMLAPDGLYSNADCEATSYDGQGYSVYPSAGGRWVKSVSKIEVIASP